MAVDAARPHSVRRCTPETTQDFRTKDGVVRSTDRCRSIARSRSRWWPAGRVQALAAPSTAIALPHPFEEGCLPTTHPSLPFKPQDSPGIFGSMPGRNRGRPGSLGILGTGVPTVKNSVFEHETGTTLRAEFVRVWLASQGRPGEEREGCPDLRRHNATSCRRYVAFETVAHSEPGAGGASFQGTCAGSESKLTMDACHEGL